MSYVYYNETTAPASSYANLQDNSLASKKMAASANLLETIRAPGLITIIQVAIVAFLTYLLSLSVYRLYLSPIAKFPGPKLAAISFWYEFYWDVIQPGRLTWHLFDLHKKYGPIVRITPDELHILDSSFFDELYTKPGRDKAPRFSARFGWRQDCFSTWQHDVHQLRRTALNPFFSAQKIAALQPLLRSKLTKFAQRLLKAHDIGAVVPMNLGYMALTADITTEYAFAKSYDQLDVPGFKENYDKCLKALYELGNAAIHITWIHRVLDSTPRAITAIVNPVVLPIIDFYDECQREIHDIRTEINENHKSAKNSTIFYELLNSTVLPQHEKTDVRLKDEAVEIVAAGIITTSTAMTLGTFHILNSPQVSETLVAELKHHFPSGLHLSNLETDKSALEWRKLESLPYLTGCIRESLRMMGGVICRDPRIARAEPPIQYKTHVIPKGTILSMTTWHVSNDPEIFPEPEKFKPERWLLTATDGTKEMRNPKMDRWLVSFGKGARQCAGINLAFAELYLCFAVVFRMFDLRLFETDVSDVRPEHAYMVPYPKADSKGLRVRVVGLRD